MLKNPVTPTGNFLKFGFPSTVRGEGHYDWGLIRERYNFSFLSSRFSQSKGFHCATSPTGAFRCLGKGKGRRYEAMSNEAYQFLNDYYRVPNLRLADQLTELKKPLPKWLQKEIKERTPT